MKRLIVMLLFFLIIGGVLYAEIIESVVDSLPPAVRLPVLLGLLALGIASRWLKVLKPFEGAVSNLRKSLVTSERMSKVVDEILVGFHVHDAPLREWLGKVLGQLATRVPDFRTLSRSQQASILANLLARTKVFAFKKIFPSLPADILEAAYARKTVAKRIIMASGILDRFFPREQ
jgi:hypothetical protein